MLSACYDVNGRRHPTYRDAVFFILGPRASACLWLAQHAMLVLGAIGYEIAAADSMSYIAQRTCSPGRPCMSESWKMALLFGGVQVLLSILPNLESLWFASILGATMSLAYSLLTVALGAASAGNGRGSLWGQPAASPVLRVWSVFNALGQMVFAYGCAIVQLEIQSTLKEPPKAEVSMRKSIWAAFGTAGALYAAVSALCYSALGDEVHGSVLLNFKSSLPWVTVLGNALVLIHMVSAYQIFCQPFFATLEHALVRLWPRLAEWAEQGHRRDAAIRFAYRTAYVGVLTTVSILLPFFGAFIGLMGSIAFWPLAVFFPISMYSRLHKPTGAKRLLLVVVNVVVACVSLAAAVGSLADIVSSAKEFSIGRF